MTIWLYTTARNRLAGHKLQREQVEQLAKLLGLELNTTTGAAKWMQDERDSDILDKIVRTLAKPGDTLIVAEPGSLGATPSAILENSSKLVGKGVTVLVASLSGELSLATLRKYLQPAIELEATLADLKAEMAKQAREHEAEFAQFQVTYEADVFAMLRSKGISLGSLIRAPSDPEPGNVRAGRQLRAQREVMGLSQTEAGQLLVALGKPALDKPAVSRIESVGSGAPHFADLNLALALEQGKRSKAKSVMKEPIEASPVPSFVDEVAVRVIAEAGGIAT